MIDTFSLSFIQSHQDAFDEYLALLTLASQNSIGGIESHDEYSKAKKIQTILKARRSSGLTSKEAEALDGCLGLMSESQFVPSVSSLPIGEEGFILNEDGGFMLQETSAKIELE